MLRPTLTGPAAATLLMLLVTGCGGSAGAPDDSTSAAQSDAAESDATLDQIWDDAWASRGQPLGFKASVGVGSVALLSTDGSWTSDGPAWSAETTATDPEDGTSYTMLTRSVSDATWMQVADWPQPSRGCWLAIESGQVPLGLLAQVPGTPGYVSVLDGFEPRERGSDAGVIEGTVPLADALGLLNVQVMQALGIDDASAVEGEVELDVALSGESVDRYDLAGADLGAALEAAGQAPPADVAELVSNLAVSVVLYHGAGAPEAERPADSTVFTVDDEGCRA